MRIGLWHMGNGENVAIGFFDKVNFVLEREQKLLQIKYKEVL